MLELQSLETINYNGENFPEIIQKILSDNGVIFGGSSLIHDVYFPEEDWGERDYDLWCLKSSYSKIHSNLRRNKNAKKLKEEIFQYSHLKMEAIAEFKFNISENNSIKIQLINVGLSFDNMINNLDFSFISVLYDGTKIHFLKTTKQEVLEKKGNVLIFNNSSCSCGCCPNEDITQKTINRILKYEKRGFTFQNICPFCRSKKIHELTDTHLLKCKFKYKPTKYINNDFPEEKLPIIDELSISNNPEIITCCLSIYARTLQMEKFINLFNSQKHILKIHSQYYERLINDCLKNGLFTFFKLLFEFGKYDYENTGKFFLESCSRNYINISRYLAGIYERLKLEIFEDKIIEYKILSIFEYYLETNNPSILSKEMPNIQFTEIKYDDDGEEIICPICKFYPTNITLKCGHDFCDKCIILYFANEDNKKYKLKCAVCRTNI